MKITVEDFIKLIGLEDNEHGALTVLLNDIEFPATISWDMLELKDEVDKQQKNVIAMRTKLFGKYGTDNKDGSFTILRTNLAEYNKEYSSLIKKEISLPDIAPVDKGLLMDSKIKVRHLQMLKKYGFVSTPEVKKEAVQEKKDNSKRE